METENDRTAGEVYSGIVAEIIDARPTESAYVPTTVPDLTIVNRREPATPDDLQPAERHQLTAFFHPEPLAAVLAEPEEPLHIEVAEVVDETGTVRYRLYGWDFGAGVLFPPDGLDIVAFGAQHDIEHWEPGQRDLFVAMDRARRKGGHGFEQPLSWCWTRDECWTDFSRTSRPYFQRQFAAWESPPTDREM